MAYACASVIYGYPLVSNNGYVDYSENEESKDGFDRM